VPLLNGPIHPVPELDLSDIAAGTFPECPIPTRRDSSSLCTRCLRLTPSVLLYEQPSPASSLPQPPNG